MRLPPFSPPFWAWLVIGVAYYLVDLLSANVWGYGVWQLNGPGG